ncbi:MAG: hypothetical protein KA250_12450 [Verrucomicrobiales bacterium]|nr:hypothetical protein [Verrucomicrobiales bacterium]
MTSPSPSSPLLPFVAFWSMLLTVGTMAAEVPQFSVRFEASEVRLSGQVDSEDTVTAILKVITGTRPDLKIVNEGLTVDPSVEFPNLPDVNSLLTEIALSTVEGRLELWRDHLLVSGLSDSLVTLTALKIRAEPILHGRAFFSRICVVPTEDLPIASDLPAGGSLTQIGLDPDFLAPVQVSFEVPGIRLEKLFPTLVMLSSFDRLEGKSTAPITLTSPASPASPVLASIPLRAVPMEMTESAPSSGTTPPTGIAALLAPAAPGPQIETLPSIHFSTNSFLPRANQNEILDQISKHLLSPARIGVPVRIEAVKAGSGSGVFGDYLCERRSSEVIRFLTERGVNPAVFSVGSVNSPNAVDDGEVRIQVEIPPPPAGPGPAGPGPAGPGPAPVVVGTDGSGGTALLPASLPPSLQSSGEVTPSPLSNP